jgi:hypothetical protein
MSQGKVGWRQILDPWRSFEGYCLSSEKWETPAGSEQRLKGILNFNWIMVGLCRNTLKERGNELVQIHF